MRLLLALGSLLLIIGVGALTALNYRASPEEASLTPLPRAACASPGPALSQLRVLPASAGEITASGQEVRLYSTGALFLRSCQDGQLTFTAQGQTAQGWWPQLAISRNGRLIEEEEVRGERHVSLRARAGDSFVLAFTNDPVFNARRYLTVTRRKGPWCPTDPGRAEGGAWMRPGGEYGDITGGGKLHFKTCGGGTALFRVEGVPADGQAPIMQVLVNGRPSESQAVTQRRLVSVQTSAPSIVTFTVLNPSQTPADRRLSLKDLALR